MAGEPDMVCGDPGWGIITGMTTRVVNLRKESYDVYIGRAGHGNDGYFGNPFSIGKDGVRGAVISLYRAWFYDRLSKDADFKARVEGLRGQVLGCFCAPVSGLTKDDRPFVCHGQVIAEYLDTSPSTLGQGP